MIKKIFTPFEKISKSTALIISGVWIIGIIIYWVIATSGEKHLFPPPGQVGTAFKDLWNEGVVTHITSSLLLCFKAVFISIIISCIIVYLSPLPALNPVANFLSKLRFLPFTGLTYFLIVASDTQSTTQVLVLVIFMSLYFITSLLAVIKDIPQEEIDHARSLKCTRWQVLWEVVIKGRLDYLFDVLRQNLAIVWMMLVTVESILISNGGLGVLIKNSDKFANHGRVIALQIIILIIGLSLDWFLNFSRKTIFKYSTF